MKRLLIVFLALTVTSVFAYGVDKHINLGDRATELKNEGKSRGIHPSLSEIRKMHPEFLLHKRDKTVHQGIRTRRNSLKEWFCFIILAFCTNKNKINLETYIESHN
jgi:hypothetical protein